MKIKLLLLLFSFLAIQTQAQNQMTTYKSHTTFSNKSKTVLLPDWNFDGNSHQFIVDNRTNLKL